EGPDRTSERRASRCRWRDDTCAVPDVALMHVVKALSASGNQPSTYVAVNIDCEDLTETILTNRGFSLNFFSWSAYDEKIIHDIFSHSIAVHRCFTGSNERGIEYQ